MARIRTVKPEFWVSEQVGDCSPNARLTFIGMWNFCDDNGVHPAKAKTLRAELFAMDDFSVDEVAGWIDELIRARLVDEFDANGQRYWFVTGWHRHQKIEKKTCRHPMPPGVVQQCDTEDSPTARRLIDEDSPTARRVIDPGRESNGLEVKGIEGKGAESTPANPNAEAAAGASADTTGEDSTRGKRLGKEWALPKQWGDWAQTEYPHWTTDIVRMIAATFRDHWVAQSGKAGVKSDWEATWRNWCRSAITQRAYPAPRGAVATASRADRIARAQELLLQTGTLVKPPAADPNVIDMEANGAR